jgi:hypothetical protein
MLRASSLLLLAHANLLTLTDRYTADPAPLVFEGRLYIFTSHDLPNMTGWDMFDYSLMSTDDLANYRDEGIVFDLRNQSWGVHAWAQQVIQGADNNFYMCVCKRLLILCMDFSHPSSPFLATTNTIFLLQVLPRDGRAPRRPPQRHRRRLLLLGAGPL